MELTFWCGETDNKQMATLTCNFMSDTDKFLQLLGSCFTTQGGPGKLL